MKCPVWVPVLADTWDGVKTERQNYNSKTTTPNTNQNKQTNKHYKTNKQTPTKLKPTQLKRNKTWMHINKPMSKNNQRAAKPNTNQTIDLTEQHNKTVTPREQSHNKN
jgi:hypothetical protein